MKITLRSKLAFLLILTLGLSGQALLAAADSGDGDPDAVGHSVDSNYLGFAPFPSVELPRLMLIKKDDGGFGFDMFGSTHSALESGRYHLRDANGDRIDDGTMHELIEAHDHLYFPLTPNEGTVFIDFSITKNLVGLLIASLLLLLMAFRLAAKYKKGIGVETAPKGTWQNMLEAIIVFIREDVAKPALHGKYMRYMPYLLTIFFLILICNLIGLIPWGISATASIAVTGVLALFTFFITQFSGTGDYWKHIFWPPDVPVFIKLILIPVEIIGVFVKPLALAARLFGNIIAGHIVIVTLIGLIFVLAYKFGTTVGWATSIFSVILTALIYLLKIFVSFVQAYIFTMLSAVFIGMAAEEHHHDDHAHEHDHGHALEPAVA